MKLKKIVKSIIERITTEDNNTLTDDRNNFQKKMTNLKNCLDKIIYIQAEGRSIQRST